MTIAVSQLNMSTAKRPQTSGQTKPVHCVIDDILHSTYAATSRCWSSVLSVAESVLNMSMHTSNGSTLLFVNRLTHPHISLA